MLLHTHSLIISTLFGHTGCLHWLLLVCCNLTVKNLLLLHASFLLFKIFSWENVFYANG